MQLTALINQIEDDDYKMCLLELEDNGILDSEDYEDKTRFIDDLSNYNDNMISEMMSLMKAKLSEDSGETKTVTETVKVKISSRPLFTNFIAQQTPAGNWEASSTYTEMINNLIADGKTFENFTGRQNLINAIPQKQSVEDQQSIICTLLALFFLREAYADNESQWTLIAKKAYTWLKKYNIADADAYIKFIKIRT